MFPNILNFISKDAATPWLQYAIVLNGKLMATNNKMACYISVDTFIEDPEQIKAIEGKVFNSTDLIYLKGETIVFSDTGFVIQGTEPKVPYTGIIGPNREIQLFDDLMDDYNLVRGFKKFPDFTTIIPGLTDNDIDVTKIQKRNTHFRSVGLSPSMLTGIAKSFQQFTEHDSDHLRLEFFHAAKDKDKVDKPSAPILVTPFRTKFPLYREAAIINPILLSNDK